MSKMRAALIAALATSAASAACSDSSPSIAAPGAGSSTSGTYTSTIWRPGEDGLQYVGARTGLYQSSVTGKTISDSGTVVQLDGADIAIRKQSAETESALARINTPASQLSALRSTGSRYRPQLHNAQTTQLGSRDGHSFALQQSTEGTPSGAPSATTIITVDGKPVGIRSSRFKKVRGKWATTHTSTSVIDSAAATQFVVETDYGVDGSRSLSMTDRITSGAIVVGDALASLVLPATLSAETMADDAIPCQTELNDMLKATAVWAAAAGALAGATVSCPTVLFTCAAIPFMQLALVAADVGLGVATGTYVACLANYNRMQNAPPSGGGTTSGGKNCTTIDWYISTDGGNSWRYLDSSTSCGSDEVYAM